MKTHKKKIKKSINIERILPATGELVVPVGDNVVAVGERVVTVGERVVAVGDKVVPVGAILGCSAFVFFSCFIIYL